MNNLGRILLLVGVVVLALLIGVLIGRGQRVEPTSEGNAAAVQITTAAPPAVAAAPAPLLPTAAPPPVEAPKPAAVPKPAPDLQVQEDAAAVGMTTREQRNGGDAQSDAPAPKSAAAGSDDSSASQPIG